MATVAQQKAIDYLVSKHGLPLYTAQGIVGGLSGESGTNLDTKARNKGDGTDGSDSVGIAQWNGMRVVNGTRFLGKPLAEANGYEQLDFLVHELSTTEKNAKNMMKQADNAADVTRAFVKHFERPADAKAGDIRAKNYTSILTGVKPTEGFVAPERKPVTPEQQKAADDYAQAEQDRISANITKQTDEAVKEHKGENDVPWYDIYGLGSKFGKQIANRGIGTVAGEVGSGVVDGLTSAGENIRSLAVPEGSMLDPTPNATPTKDYLTKQAEANATSMGYTGGKFIGETSPLLAVPMASAPTTAGLATRAAYVAGNAIMQGTAAYATSGDENRTTSGLTAAGLTAAIPAVGRSLGWVTKHLPDAYPTAARATQQVGRDLYTNLGGGSAGTSLDDAARVVADTNLAKFRTNVNDTSLIQDVKPTTQEVLGNKFYNDEVKLNAAPTLINANEANYAARQAFIDSPTASLRDKVVNPFSLNLPINGTKTSDNIANDLQTSIRNRIDESTTYLKDKADRQYRLGTEKNGVMVNPKDIAVKVYQNSVTTADGELRNAMVQPELSKILQAYGDSPTVGVTANHQLRGDLKAYLKTLETSKEPNVASKQKVVNDILDTTKFDLVKESKPSNNYIAKDHFNRGDELYAKAKELEDLALYKTVTKPQSAEQSVGNIASTAKGRGELNQYLDNKMTSPITGARGNVDVVNPMRNSVWDAVTKTKGDAPLVLDDKLQQKIIEANVDGLATKLGMTKELEALSKEIKFTRNSKGTMVLGSNTTEKLMNVISGKGLNIASAGAVLAAIHTGGLSVALPAAVALYKATARKAFIEAFNKAGVNPKLAEEAIDKFLAREATEKLIDKVVTKAIKVGTKSSSVIAQDTN